ncbi:hypothetical protein BDZ89DRAFT_1068639 [Hymenopellis radicata]|nr:hypothetical protein BDZ89DRAFT_1068639 [Hymenopellis radicata]
MKEPRGSSLPSRVRVTTSRASFVPETETETDAVKKAEREETQKYQEVEYDFDFENWLVKQATMAYDMDGRSSGITFFSFHSLMDVQSSFT